MRTTGAAIDKFRWRVQGASSQASGKANSALCCYHDDVPKHDANSRSVRTRPRACCGSRTLPPLPLLLLLVLLLLLLLP